MEKHQEPATVRDIALEVKMHRIFDAWSEAHTTDYPGIGVLPYDPELYPYQRIDRHVVEPRIRSTYIPAKIFAYGMGRAVISSFRDKQNGKDFIENFWTTPAYPDEPESLAEVIAEDYLDQGKSVALITDHADNLADIGRVCAGLNVALAQNFGKKYMDSFGLLTNKNMTRETYKNKPVVARISQIAEVHTVLPDTASVEKYRKIASTTDSEITEEDVERISQKVTGGTARVIFSRLREGVKTGRNGLAEGIVPTGQGTIKLRDRYGEIKAHSIPPVTNTAASLLARFDAVVAVSIVGDRYKVSPIIPIGEKTGKIKDSYQSLFVVENIMDQLADQTTEVAGVPVHYQRLSPTQAG